MEISKGAPAGFRRKDGRHYDELVAAAIAEPGEWFSMPTEEGYNNLNGLRTALAYAVAEFSQRDNRVWIRVKP